MKKAFLMLLGFCSIAAITLSDILQDLNLSKEDAKECLLLSIGDGLLNRGAHSELVSSARSLPVAIQVAGTRQLMQLAKEYTESDQFKADYKKWRNKKLNPDSKTKLGLPKLGKIIDNKIDNQLDKGENEKRYPADPQELVKKRLADFLSISATVDFEAEVKNREFVDPAYRRKPAQWKMCFRAGREVVEAAREDAQKWLNELTTQ